MTTTLGDVRLLESAKIINLECDGPVRRRLLDLGLTPKTLVTVTNIAPMGDPIQISLRGYELSLRKDEAKKIIVSKE